MVGTALGSALLVHYWTLSCKHYYSYSNFTMRKLKPREARWLIQGHILKGLQLDSQSVVSIIYMILSLHMGSIRWIYEIHCDGHITNDLKSWLLLLLVPGVISLSCTSRVVEHIIFSITWRSWYGIRGQGLSEGSRLLFRREEEKDGRYKQ